MSLGTPHYMSPEQATAEKQITARSDIYSLGSVLYEMLTGNPPHVGASAQQIIMKIVTEEAAPVTKLRKAVPPNVADAVAKSLEKLPADRFATAAEFGAALGNPGFASLGGSTGAERVVRSGMAAAPLPRLAGLWRLLARSSVGDCALGLVAPGAGRPDEPPAGGPLEVRVRGRPCTRQGATRRARRPSRRTARASSFPTRAAVASA